MFSNERRVSNHLQGMRSDGIGLFALQEVYGMIHRLLDPEEGGQDDASRTGTRRWCSMFWTPSLVALYMFLAEEKVEIDPQYCHKQQ